MPLVSIQTQRKSVGDKRGFTVNMEGCKSSSKTYLPMVQSSPCLHKPSWSCSANTKHNSSEIKM